ncbi:hypothetical protein C8F04DRAFT_1400472 [Mycena alexandri]|uniref:Uncharacterized protein n=1 Tax=Mycena alexandri TaxID=1745969 RepID=A0AAD6SF97_9AGAR|nr:hypothetical protein C8F04DRAFT_1400472 [Mycena alexandri]
MESAKNQTNDTSNATGEKSFNLGARRASSPIVPLAVVQQRLQAFNAERERYTRPHEHMRSLANERDRDNTAAAAATAQLRANGGIASSAAFAKEHAAEDAALRGGSSISTPVTSKDRREQRIEQASPAVPPSFAVGPSSATRPISRAGTAQTIGGEDDLALGKELAIDLTGGDNPIAAPDPISTLKLHGPPTKEKGKGETASALGTRTSTNTMILAAHIVGMQQKHAALALDVANTTRRLESKISHAAAGGTIDGMADMEITHLKDGVEHGKTQIARLEREYTRLLSAFTLLEASFGGTNSTVTPAKLNDLANEVKDEFGVVYGDLQVLQDAHRRSITRDDDIETLTARVDMMVAENDKLRSTNELLASKLALVETKAAIGDAKMIDLEKQVLSLHETVAGEQLAALKKSAADTSAEGEGERRTFQLGNARSNKRGAPADAEASSSKRTKLPPGVGEKSDYPVWVKMLGLAANVTGTPVNIFSRMVKVALVVEKFELPSRVFVERNKAGTELSIGFLKTSEAQALVRAWGDEPNRAFADVKVVMDKDSSAGMTYGMYKRRRRE